MMDDNDDNNDTVPGLGHDNNLSGSEEAETIEKGRKSFI
jgi:hypothetical protein